MKKMIVPALVLCTATVATWVYVQRHENFSSPEDNAIALEASATTSAQTQPARIRSNNTRPSTRTIEVVSTHLARDFAQLQQKAKNDPAFAHALARKLHECNNLTRSVDDAKALDDENFIGEKNMQTVIDGLKAKVSVCENLTDAQLLSYVEMIDFAAASGIVEAQIDYRVLVGDAILTEESIVNPKRIEEYKTKSMRYYHSAVESGHWPALSALAFAYSKGILTKKDDYAAYKYLMAYDLAAPNRGPTREESLSQFKSRLTQQQIIAAQRDATALYNDCCRK
jgi:TPR repeat protein